MPTDESQVCVPSPGLSFEFYSHVTVPIKLLSISPKPTFLDSVCHVGCGFADGIFLLPAGFARLYYEAMLEEARKPGEGKQECSFLPCSRSWMASLQQWSFLGSGGLAAAISFHLLPPRILLPAS